MISRLKVFLGYVLSAVLLSNLSLFASYPLASHAMAATVDHTYTIANTVYNPPAAWNSYAV